jgi:hypothetical protein
LYTPTLDIIERFIDIFELLHTELWAGGIAAEGLVAQNLEQVDEDDLSKVSVGECFLRGKGVNARTPSERSVMRSSISTSRALILLFNLAHAG